MKPGDIAKVVGLKRHPERNGTYVHILRELSPTAVPEGDDPRPVPADRYGFEFMSDGVNGYIRPENLEHQVGLNFRSVCIHLFGEEDPPWI